MTGERHKKKSVRVGLTAKPLLQKKGLDKWKRGKEEGIVG